MYIYPVTTEYSQDKKETGARIHAEAVNAYLMFPVANGKKRHVHEMSTAQVIVNMNVVTTTFLCCDEDDQ